MKNLISKINYQTSSCFAKASTDLDVSAESSRPPSFPVPFEHAIPGVAAAVDELAPETEDDTLLEVEPSASSCPSSISPVANGDGGTAT